MIEAIGERHASACRYKNGGTGGLAPLRSPDALPAARSLQRIISEFRRNLPLVIPEIVTVSERYLGNIYDEMPRWTPARMSSTVACTTIERFVVSSPLAKPC